MTLRPGSLDAVERERWLASPLVGDAVAEAHARIPVVDAVAIAEASRSRDDRRQVDRVLPLDGEWLLAGATPGREFSIERWAGAGADAPRPVDWHRTDTDRSGWLPASVPGTVQGALVAAGALPDPLLHDHTHAELTEHGVPTEWPWFFRRTRVEEQEWWYARRFRLPAEWSGGRVRLVFDGLDYSGTVFVNGAPVAQHRGMYGGPDVDVSSVVRFDAENEVVVRLDPPPRDWHGVLKPSPGWGWHYGHLISIGLWRGVRLELVPDVELVDPFVQTIAVGEAADIELQWDVVQHGAVGDDLEISIAVLGPDSAVVLERTVRIDAAPGRSRHRIGFAVDDPRVWWPFGYGDQPLYRAVLRTGDAEVRATFGIRTIEQRPLPERSGEDFYDWQFVVNGRPLFLKGANWCWTDPMARRGFDVDRHILDLVVRANLQMLRAWGGGTIESDEFYEECDRRGILVYQEFPLNFGLDSPGADLRTIDDQVSRVVRRLRNHPSLVMWGGGNENPATLTSDDLLTVVGRRVTMLDPGRAFHRTDPWGGSEHYYGVYHEGRPVATYAEFAPAVFGEYGLSSQCDLASMRRFLDPRLLEEWPPPEHGAILQHQAQFSRFDLVKQARYADYGPIRDWVSFVEFSQVAQGDALRFASERTRARSGESAAAYWFYKVGEVFPGASWAVIDYDGVPKLSYYRAKQFSAAVSAFAVTDETDWEAGDRFEARIHVANDRPAALDGATVLARLYDARFRLLATESRPVNLDADERTEALTLEAVVPRTDHAPLLWSVRLVASDGGLLSDAWYSGNAHAKPEAVRELEALPLDDLAARPVDEVLAAYAAERAAPLLELPRTVLDARLDGDAILVSNEGPHPAPLVLIDGFPHALGRRLDDNAFGLDAGESRRIAFDAGDGDLSELRVRAWNADSVPVRR